MAIELIDYTAKAEGLLRGFSPVDRDWLLVRSGFIQDIEVVSQKLLQPGRPMWNTIAFWKAIGGCMPESLYVEDDIQLLSSMKGVFMSQSEHVKEISVEDSLQLENSTIIVRKTNKPFGLTGDAAENFMAAMLLKNNTITTENGIVRQAVMNAELTEEQFNEYISLLEPKQVTVDGKVYNEIKTGRFVSVAFRFTEEGNLVVLRGLREYEGRFVYAINGQPKSKYLVYAVVLNYLLTAGSENTLNGRLAFMNNVFLDDIYVGTGHDLLKIQKQYKMGNLIVAASNNPRVPQVRKGGKQEMEAAAQAFHSMGIVTAMHKAGKYLLVDKGAMAAGFGMDAEGNIMYWLDADKASKKVGGRHLHGVATAYSAYICNSGIGIRIDGKVNHYKGNKFVEMRLQSPLAPEGSGNFMYNPEMDDVTSPHHQSFGQTRVYFAEVAGSQFGEAGAQLTIVTAKVGDVVEQGDMLIGQKSLVLSPSTGKLDISPKVKNVMERSNTKGVVKEVVTRWNDQTSNYSVKVVVEELSVLHAQKYRGVSKGRASAFCLDVEVYDSVTGKVYFDPKLPLGPVGDLEAENCVERLLSDEEGKTKLHLMEMASHDGCEMIWDGVKWENEEQFDKWVVKNRKVVTIRRSNIEKNVYTILKNKFGSDPNFEFKDQERSIVHKNAQAWIGEVTSIVEVPLTHTFVGKTSLFGEVISYAGIQYPELYDVLLDGVIKNQVAVSEVYSMAQDASAEAFDNRIYPIIALDDEYGTFVEFVDGDAVEVDFEFMSQDQALILLDMSEEEYISTQADISLPILVTRIGIPGKEVNLDTFRQIQKALMAKGEAITKGQTPHDFSRVALVLPDPLKMSILRFDAFARATSTSSQNAAQNLIRILLHLGGEGMGTSNDQLQKYRNSGGWESIAARLMALFQGAMKSMAVESNSLMSKIARTEAIAFQCRAATTISGDCSAEQALVHPKMAAKLGLEDGDIVLVGRNPMPKLGALKLSINERAPMDTLLMNAFSWHSFNEGDADGDSVFFITITPSGDIVVPCINNAATQF